MSKIVGPSLFGLYDFEFMDKKHYTEKVDNNIQVF